MADLAIGILRMDQGPYYLYLATGATFEKQSEKPVCISRSFGKRKNRLFFCAHTHTVETK
jgi:hypothetical protein